MALFQLTHQRGADQTATINLIMNSSYPDSAGGSTTFGDTPMNDSDAVSLTFSYTIEQDETDQTTEVYVKNKAGLNDTATVHWWMDNTDPSTVDNISNPFTNEWYDDDAIILFTVTDNDAGYNRTDWCVYEAPTADCTYQNLTTSGVARIPCSANSACLYTLKYRSVDNVRNLEGDLTAPLFIAMGSTINSTTANYTNISGGSVISKSNLTNATISGCTITESDINNSILRYNASFTNNCHIEFSDIDDSNLTSTVVRNSIIDPSSLIDSIIVNSTLPNTTAFYSRVENAVLCANMELYDAVIRGDMLISGQVTYDGTIYYGPYPLSSICGGAPPTPRGTFGGTPAIVNDNTTITFAYNGYNIGSTVYITNTSLQTLDDSGTNVNLLDDGNTPDEDANDAIYTGSYLISEDNTITDGNKTIELNITDFSTNSWLVDTIITLDNTNPSATIQILPISQPGWENQSSEYTGSTTVILNTTYADLNSIDKCRYYETAWTDWENCIPQRTFIISEDDGLKTVIYQVRDTAGNINETNDTITLSKSGAGLDITPPTGPKVYDDGNWTNSQNTLHAWWNNASDYESELLHIPLSYEYRILKNGSAYVNTSWTNTTLTEVSVTSLTLTNASNYTFEVRAINSVGLRSNTSYSDGIIVDHDSPGAPVVNSSTHANESAWYTANSVLLSWNASDPLSGIGAYSYLIDTANDTAPDQIPEGAPGQLEDELNTSYSGLGDGTLYFHIHARDKAGNWGSARHFRVNIDASGPSTPQMGELGTYINDSDADFNWTRAADLQSGVSNYHFQVSNDSAFNTTIHNDWVGNETNKTITIPGPGVYYARVLAQNGAGINSSYSDTTSTILDTTPPTILFFKPRGTVVSTSVLFVVETDEDATCQYAMTTPPGIFANFSFTGSTLHESRMTSLNTTDFNYTFRCADTVGNENSTTTAFTVTALSPDSVTIDTDVSGFTDNIINFNITVSNSGTGLGEVKKDYTSLTLDSYHPDYTLNDRGEGAYIISFRAPETAGNYTLTMNVSDITETTTAEISDLSLQVNVGNIGGVNSRNGTHTTFTDLENTTFGIGSDSPSVSIASTSTGLELTANAADGKIYIFATKPQANVLARDDLFKNQLFDELIRPSFGYQLEETESLIQARLGYGDIIIRPEGLTSRELGPGTYNLIIKHATTEFGKTIIEVAS
ncbi:MAG: fibronectin type III domain-containing protein [Nanoarchaeota archaeon]